jgi:hypothetical protein
MKRLLASTIGSLVAKTDLFRENKQYVLICIERKVCWLVVADNLVVHMFTHKFINAL